MKFATALSFCLLVSIVVVSAQETYRQYRTTDYVQLLKSNKAFAKAQTKTERAINGPLRFVEVQEHTIPVVFHILHNTAEEAITTQQLQQQLDILNQDFADEAAETFKVDAKIGDHRNLGKYEKRRSTTNIQFCLAQEHEGQPAVNYIGTNIQEWSDFYSMKESRKGSTPWNTSHYLNIWICNLPATNAGFAQMPGGPSEYDGIVIDYSFIANIGNPKSRYNAGHTLTHLVGNYLGLHPLWGLAPCEDDHVDDTPVHNAPNFHCESIEHLSTCSGNPTEMINNFMDNTDDECLSMFTEGQKTRMQQMLSSEGPRGGLSAAASDCDAMPTLEEQLTETTLEFEEEDHMGVPSLHVRPNPAKDLLYIDFSENEAQLSKPYQIQIYSIAGQLMTQRANLDSDFSLQLDVSRWPGGLYMVHLISGEQRFLQRFVVE